MLIVYRVNNTFDLLTLYCEQITLDLTTLHWIKVAFDLLTSVDMEGTRNGYDLNLVKAVSSIISVPVIASGGYGQPSHLLEVLGAGADAIAIADALHYRRTTFPELRDYARKTDIPVREFQ